MGCGVSTNAYAGTFQLAAMARAVSRKGAVMIATAGIPCISRRIASSTLLELHEPQSPMPDTTKSTRRLNVSMAVSATSWLGDRLRSRCATVML